MAQTITFDHSPNGYPRSLNRLQSEIYLLNDPATSKAVIEIPAEHIDLALVRQLAKQLGVKLMQEGDAYYLARPSVGMNALRRAIKNNEHGEYLGHPCATCPDEGIDYAVSIEGDGSIDPEQILAWRNTDRLGWAGRAPDAASAQSKMAEFGQALGGGSKPACENCVEGETEAEPIETPQEEQKTAQTCDMEAEDTCGCEEPENDAEEMPEAPKMPDLSEILTTLKASMERPITITAPETNINLDLPLKSIHQAITDLKGSQPDTGKILTGLEKVYAAIAQIKLPDVKVEQKTAEPASYTFEIVRGRDGLIQSIIAEVK